ncbi:MAG: hypothetical protein ABSH56_01100 [Bryobacteraceae bacterium]|jgi:hypothetical protein
MAGKNAILAIDLLAFAIGTLAAQSTGSTSLLLQVGPEARLEPQQVALNFRVSVDGSSDLISQTVSVTAWVRALPGRRIRIAANLRSLTGPNGPVPVTEVAWAGSATRASAGAQAATCSSGTFQTGVAADLVEGWERSGVLNCTVSFALAAPRNLPPGVYSGALRLSVGAP